MNHLKPVTLGVTLVIFAASHAGSARLPKFKLAASDGKSYSAGDLESRKPTLVVFFAAGCPHNSAGIKDMNRLMPMLAGKLRIVGMTNLDARQVKQFAHNHLAKFPVLADPKSEVMTKIGAVAGLDNALILPNGQIDHVWNGYNRSTLRQLEKELRAKAGVSLNIDLSSFPKDREIGCAIGMQMN